MKKLLIVLFLIPTLLLARTDTILYGKYIQNGTALVTLPNSNVDMSALTAITGNNTGDVTLGTANGLSLSGQILSLQNATSLVPGALSAADWSTFNSKEPAITGTSISDYYGGDKAFHAVLSLPISTAAQNALNLKVNSASLAAVATSGSYTDLINQPTIPAAQVNSDWNSSSGLSQILNKPTIPAAQVNSDWNSSSGLSQILNKPSLATVATSGAYSDLSGTPTLLSQFTNDPGYLTSIPNGSVDLTTKVSGILPIANGGTNSSTALANNKVMISSGGSISESSTSTTTLGYLDATSSIQTQLNGKEPSITSGTISQFWRGDKSFQTPPNFVGDNFGGSVSGYVPSAISGQGQSNYYLGANGSFNYVDVSKNRPVPFALQSMTSQPAALGKLSGISILGNYAYVSGNQPATLSIFDISNQNAPVLKSTLTAGTFGSYSVFPFTSGGHTYVAIPSSGAIGKLLIVNVDNPSAPSITTTYVFSTSPISVGSLYDCAVYNGYIYIASQSAGLLVLDIGGGSGSIASPSPVFQESTVLNAVKSFGVTVANGTLFTTQYITSVFGTRQIKSWNISTPSTPSLLQSYQVTSVGEPLGITVSGNTAVVAVTGGGTNAYDLVDVTTPSSMNNLSQITTSGTLSSGMKGYISGNYLYMPSGSNATDGGYIDFYDITTLSSPIKISTVKTGIGTSVFGSIALSNGYIYAADYGIAPGSNGSLDVFTAPVETSVIGNLKVGSLTASSFSAPGLVDTSTNQTIN